MNSASQLTGGARSWRGWGGEPGGSHRALEVGGGASAGSGSQSSCARGRQARGQIWTLSSNRHSQRRTEGAGLAPHPRGKPRAPASCPACLSPLRREGGSHIHPVPPAREARRRDGPPAGPGRAPRARLSALCFREHAFPSDLPRWPWWTRSAWGSNSKSLKGSWRGGPPDARGPSPMPRPAAPSCPVAGPSPALLGEHLRLRVRSLLSSSSLLSPCRVPPRGPPELYPGFWGTRSDQRTGNSRMQAQR